MEHRLAPLRDGARQAFSLIEMVVALAIVLILASLATAAGWRVYESSSLAVSANNLRQLGAGMAGYFGDNEYTFWKYREWVSGEGVQWWFGLEPTDSFGRNEGERLLRASEGPLGPYMPSALRPDPSFSFTGKAFKPKFAHGYIGIGYNIHLADRDSRSWAGWSGYGDPMTYWQLEDPSKTVVFATSAQVNTFQPPASGSNPMIEEFYGIDENEVTIHGRHGWRAMVVFASGNVGFLELDESTLDSRAPKASIGRFAPRGNAKYLK